MISNHSITITDDVFRRLTEISNQSLDKKSILRISVLGGGCSGFKYSYDLVDNCDDSDLIFEKDNLKIIIDPISADFMKGCTINFVDELGFSHFEIKNPNASSKCGCGSSFSI